MQDDSIIQWLKNRHNRWERLENLLAQQTGRRDESDSDVLEFVNQYQSLVRDVSLSRKILPNSRITRYLDSLLRRSLRVIYRKPYSPWSRLKTFFRTDIPNIIIELRRPIFFSFVIFLISGMCGWLLVYKYPELAALFASEKMIAHVQQGQLWTDDLLNVVPSSILSLSIMTNNIMVSFFAFVLGSFYGLGTLYILGINGVMLGAVFALTRQYGLDMQLLEFIIAHGLVELSVIVLASAAGIKLGEAIIRPGNRTRTQAFQSAVNQSIKLITIGVPLLVGAGLIEGYISPNDKYDFATRLSVGFAYWVFMVILLSGKIWTLGKVFSTPTSKAQ